MGEITCDVAGALTMTDDPKARRPARLHVAATPLSGICSHNARPALARLTPCIAAFRQALPADAAPAIRALEFRLQRPGDAPGRRLPLRFEEGVPSLPKAPTYLTGITGEETVVAPGKLRLAPDSLRTSKLHEKLAATAQAALAADPAGGGVSRMTFHRRQARS